MENADRIQGEKIAADRKHRAEVDDTIIACFKREGVRSEAHSREIISMVSSGKIDFMKILY